VRRGAESEGVQEEAELLAGLLLADAHDREDALLDVALVDTDGTATDLVAVADDVVGVGRGLSGILVEGVDPLRLRGGEGVVDGGPLRVAEGDITGGGGVGGGLEQRGVDDPGEGPVTLLDEAETLGDLTTGGTEQGAGGLDLTGTEEDAVTRLGTDVGGDAFTLGVGDVLGDRAGQGAVLADENVGETLGSALLGPLLPGIEGTARLGGATLHDHGADVGSL
jgi:hypothetical protein